MASNSHLDKDGLMSLFRDLNVDTHTVEHPEVFTVDEMMKHLGEIDGAVAKNLFLKDKKKKGLWLFSACHDADVNLGDLSKKVNAPGGLRFADESILQEKLGVRQGCVTAYALANDKSHDVKFIVDEELLSDDKHSKIYFHPLTNAASTGISPKDFQKFLDATGHTPIKVECLKKQDK